MISFRISEWKIYKWILLIVFLASIRIWCFWKIPFFVPSIGFFFSIYFAAKHSEYFNLNKSAIIQIVLFFLAQIFTIRNGNYKAFIGMILTFSSVAFVFGLKRVYKSELLQFITKVVGALLFISLSGWFIHLLGINTPFFPDNYNDAQYSYENHFIFLVNTGGAVSVFPRFSGVFLEPGYLGVLLVILLYINEFNLRRKEILVLFFALIFTFSLAGYLMFLFAYVAYLLQKSRKAVLYMLLFMTFIWSSYTFLANYNDGNNIINKMVLERLKYDDEAGNIAGYNRTQEYFDNYFKSFWNRGDDILFGIGTDTFDFGSNVGYKVYLTQHGIFGTLLIFIAFFSVLLFNRGYSKFIIFLLYTIMFIRGHHIIYWSGFLLVYVCAMSITSDKLNSNNLKVQYPLIMN